MTYSAAFQKCIALVLEHEGGFQKKPDDRGNWVGGVVGKGELKGTNFGISAMRFPNVDIAGMTRARAIALYHEHYWQTIRGDELPFALAAVTLDAAINSGPGNAIKWLQQALGVTADGELGPVTLHAAKNAADPVKLAARACRHRLLFVMKIPNFASWGSSWIQRTLDTLALGARGV